MRSGISRGGVPTSLQMWGALIVVGLCLSSHVISDQTESEEEEEQNRQQRCHMFSVGNKERQEFYSPYFPNKYPNKTECFLVLKAPKHGYQVEVDFRDYFKLEDHDTCAHDYLEIRDGPYGYSDLKGKFCGTKRFPPLIKSKDRYLWLRFMSDETIQYEGFRAVYRYVKAPTTFPPGTLCEFEKSGEQGKVEYEDIPSERLNLSLTARIPLDCVWVVEVKPHKRIYLFFDEFKLAHPNECGTNYIDIYDGARDLKSMTKRFCGAVADTVETNGSILYFRYFGNNFFNDTKFRAWFTAFREKKAGDAKCEDDEYDCQDMRCIHEELICNERKNCRHEYDEENCDVANENKFDISSNHIIIILTLGCGLLASMCCAMCFNCIRKLVRDGRQIHENIRRSREQLEERRSASVASSPRVTHRTPITPDSAPCFIEGKPNGHTCVTAEEEDTEELEEEEEEDDVDDLDDLEETCVEMRDCECQTRDSLMNQRDSGTHGTPPPPPPPTRRPPGVPPMSPLVVPTPPPPPGSHYGYPPRPKEVYNEPPYQQGPLSHPDRYDRDAAGGRDPYREKYRAEAVIQMRDRGRYEPSKTEKTKPDVLVTH